MYEELVKRLRVECALPLSAIKDMRDAADVIEELEKAVPHWIPVESLPEIDKKHHCSKDVLVYLDGGYMAFSALEENIFGQTWFECERHSNVENEMKVTHWMPLPSAPEPPKEET